MISNEDPEGKRAFKHILACNILNSFLPLLMTSTGMLHPVLLAPFYYYQYLSIKSVFDFKAQAASPQSAKKLKRTSYMPFLILLAGFTTTTAYKRFMKRKKEAGQ